MDPDFKDMESYIPHMKHLLSMELAQEKLENETNSVPWPCAVLSLEACLCGTSRVRLCREGMESVIAESEKLNAKIKTCSRPVGARGGASGRGRKGVKTAKPGKKAPLIGVEELERAKEKEEFWRKKHGDHVFEGTASFSHGAAVVLQPKSSSGANEVGVRGVVTSVEDFALQVVLDEDIGDWGDEVRLELLNVPNETTYRRMTEALDRLGEKWMESPTAEIFFADREPSRNPKECEILWFNDQLDHSQKDSVKLAISSNEIALIHGPPGTGKTTTIVEIIRQFVRRGERVLVCGPSNISVDHIVEKLSEKPSSLPSGEKKTIGNVNMIRIGHPGRVLPSVLIHTLDSVVESSDAGGLVQDIRKEMGKLLMQVRGQRKKGKKIDRKAIFSELRSLRKELRIREKGAIRDVISHANVVLCTNVGAGDALLKDEKFTAVVLDECAQALEPSSWIPILHSPKCKVVLCGDDCQLPPTIRSEAKSLGLETTLFHRLRIRHGHTCSKMLTTQYRMNELIMSWSSKEFYDGKLEAAPSVKHHVLSDMIHVKSNEISDVPLIFYDTAGFDYEETQDDSMHGSKQNEQEAEVVRRYVDAVLKLGVKEGDIAVIAPYRAQVQHLRSVIRPFHENIEISTVDGFQGREKELVVISAVRSNTRGEVGFLADERRMNVAVTRARRQCVFICNSATLSSDPFLKRLVEHFEGEAEIRTPDSEEI